MRRLPLYAEVALAEFRATRGMAAAEFERRFREEAGAVSCRVGCDHCCHYPLLITVAEGILLYRHLGQRGRLTTALKVRLGEHADLTALIDPAVWMRARIPCPLLEGRKCQGYEGRPLACRMAFSAGDPSDCDPQAFQPEALSSREVLRVVSAFEEKLLQKHGISPVRMPVSRALLLAGRVLAQEVSLNDVERILYREYLSK